jgi:hypothetical protein
LYRIAEHVVTLAKKEYVPVEWGNLKNTGHVEMQTRLAVVMVFGGPVGEWRGPDVQDAVNYAILQHERMDYKHPKGGGPKYLEWPLMRSMATFRQDLVELCALSGNPSSWKVPPRDWRAGPEEMAE